MSGKAKAVAAQLQAIFGISETDGAVEHAEYVLSIPDADDVREWLTDALGLVDEDESKMNDFLSALVLIRDGHIVVDRPKAIVSQVSVNPPRLAPVSSSRGLESVNEPIPVPEPAVRVRKPVPAARTAMRQKCFCLAKTELGGHELIGNCLSCGRIICEAEDYGDCLTCGVGKDTVHWLDISGGDSANAAVIHKDRLVQYDREGARRTKIYDDSTDWFSEGHDVWKGKEEREEALRMAREFEEQKRQARTAMNVEIDFATGQIKVKDKAEAIHAVEKTRDTLLSEYIDRTDKAKPAPLLAAPELDNGNILDPDSQEILTILREKLGRTTQPQKPVSIFSFLDDDLNDALDSL